MAQFSTNGVIVTMRFAKFNSAVAAGIDGFKRGRALALLRSLGARFIMTHNGAYSWLGRANLERVFTSPNADIWRDDRALPRAYVARVVEYFPSDRVLSRLRDLIVADTRTAVLEMEEGGQLRGTEGEAQIVRSTA